MRTKRVTRYYCDHCSKGMFHIDRMRRHEPSCFRNPNRKCPMCKGEQDLTPERLQELEGLKEVETKGGECPWCLVAAVIRENIKNKRICDDFLSYPIEKFKADRQSWYSERGGAGDAASMGIGLLGS
jgi:hypothetical protein